MCVCERVRENVCVCESESGWAITTLSNRLSGNAESVTVVWTSRIIIDRFFFLYRLVH